MPKETKNPTLIGCELFVRKGDSILLGMRKNCFGAGTWALPGGHLEFNERLVNAIRREAKEELGADIPEADLKLISIVDDLQVENNLHYVHVSFEHTNPTWEPILMEPNRCEQWKYFEISNLPDNFFVPHSAIIKNYLSERLY